MHQKRPSDTVEVVLITGALSLTDSNCDAAFLASGTVLTPMMSMLRQYMREDTGHVHIVLGAKREETIIHRETLDELAANNPYNGAC